MIELENPQIEPVEEAGTYAKYEAGPLQAGYGVTLGNALRRVLLSSLDGAAVTSIQIRDVYQEFSTIPGVKEDVTQIVLNVKKLRLKSFATHPVQLRAPANHFAHRVADGRVGRRQLAQVALQAVRVGVHHERSPISPLDAHELVVVDDFTPGQGTELLPDPVDGRTGARAHQPLDAAVEDVAVAPPGGADPARERMHLEDPGAVPVHLCVAARGQPGHPAANDGDRCLFHGSDVLEPFTATLVPPARRPTL